MPKNVFTPSNPKNWPAPHEGQLSSRRSILASLNSAISRNENEICRRSRLSTTAISKNSESSLLLNTSHRRTTGKTQKANLLTWQNYFRQSCHK